MGLRLKSNLPEKLEGLITEVIGAAIEVHRNLGPGFIESVYEYALCHELELRGIPYERQKEILIPYKDISISGQRLDLLVDGRLILELKAVEEISNMHEAQILSYLKSTGTRIGLIINFNVKRLKDGLRRMVL